MGLMSVAESVANTLLNQVGVRIVCRLIVGAKWSRLQSRNSPTPTSGAAYVARITLTKGTLAAIHLTLRIHTYCREAMERPTAERLNGNLSPLVRPWRIV